MKKTISIIILITIIIIGLLLLKKEDQTEKQVKTEPTQKTASPIVEKKVIKKKTLPSLQSDIKLIEEKINKEITESDFWNKIVDYTLSNKEILDTVDAVKVYKYSKSVIIEIADCIKYHCGIEADADGYFDPENTTADKVLKRNLQLLNGVTEEAAILDYTIDDINFDQIFTSKNADVQVEGIKLYLANSNDPDDILGLIDRSSSFNSYTQGTFLSLLDDVTKQSPELRHAYISSIEKTMKSKQGMSIIHIAENLENLNLDIEELHNILKSTCAITSQKIKNKVYYYFAIYIKKKNLNLSLDNICK